MDASYQYWKDEILGNHVEETCVSKIRNDRLLAERLKQWRTP